MHSFEYYSPTEIVFGQGAENKLPEKIKKHGGSKVFLVYGGGSVVKSGLLERIEDGLKAAEIPYAELGGVQPNPRMQLAMEGVKQALDFGADMIIGIGGGSVIDTAKAIAHGVANPEHSLRDIWQGKVPLTKTTPVGAVLTIAAAGSETSDSAVLTDEENHKKAGINTDLNRPAFAIMNPELMVTLPKKQIACGGADIIMHTLERYFSHVEDNNFTDLVAEALMRNVIEEIPRALGNRHDLIAMSELMWCGSVSHNGFTGLGRDRDFSVHKFGHELSAKYDVTHGASLTAVWGSWARYVYKDKPERFARYAEKIWGAVVGTPEEKSRAGIRETEDYFRSIGLPVSLGELGIGELTDEDLEYLADMCTNYGKKKIGTFHPLDRDEVLAIYKMANH